MGKKVLKPRKCKRCGEEIPFGTKVVRYAGRRYHPECAVAAGLYREIVT